MHLTWIASRQKLAFKIFLLNSEIIAGSDCENTINPQMRKNSYSAQ